MQARKFAPVFALTFAAGALYLLDAWFASTGLQPCTSAGARAFLSPCKESVAIVGWVSILGFAILFLGTVSFAVLLDPRFRLIWSGLVIGTDLSCYILLLTLIPLNSYSPSALAYYWFALLFLPGLACGLLAVRACLDLTWLNPDHSQVGID